MVTISIASSSMNVPTTISMSCIMIITRRGGRVYSTTTPTSFREIPVKARIWPKAEAFMMMRKTMEVILTVASTDRPTISQVNFR